MRRVIIVQARMTSTRLPGKVLLDLAGRPLLAQQLHRLKRCRHADEIVVATTTQGADDPVVTLADREGVRWFRGNEADVLSRYVGAAREVKADVVVRVTADCPLIDPEESDRVIERLVDSPEPCDYTSNVHAVGVEHRTYPRGLDTEAMFADTIERVHRLARSAPAREHVTVYIWKERPDLFVTHLVADVEDNSDLRWTVDERADLEMMRRLYDALGVGDRRVGYRQVLAYVRAHPELSALNAAVAPRTVA